VSYACCGVRRLVCCVRCVLSVLCCGIVRDCVLCVLCVLCVVSRVWCGVVCVVVLCCMCDLMGVICAICTQCV